MKFTVVRTSTTAPDSTIVELNRYDVNGQSSTATTEPDNCSQQPTAEDVECVGQSQPTAQPPKILSQTVDQASAGIHNQQDNSHGQLNPGFSAAEQQRSITASSRADYVASIAKRGRLFARRQTRRLVQKGGECNVSIVSVSHWKRRYLADMFTTLIEMQWRYHILLFTLQFLLTWCIFGALYYAIAAVHGDTYQAENNTWVPCIANVYDYTSAFLFSLETQATIGYGLRVVNSVCEFAVFVVIVQTCAGTCVQMLATGVLFAKISRPKGRAKTLLFSRTAVICLEDGEYQLMFRVGDMRTKSHIIGSSIRALMVRSQLTADGELLPLHQEPLTLCIDACDLDDTCLFMVWPVTIVHKIDDSSPLWDISAEQLIAEQFEIIVILEGTVESTGSTTQVRTSYLPSEIRWGQRLEPLRTFHRETGCYAVDYSNFNETMPVPMPDCSARSWSENRGNSAEGAETVRYPTDQTSDNRSMASETIRSIQRIFRRRFTDFKSQRVNATVAEPVSNILRPLNVRISRPGTSALQPREINNNNGIHLLHRITENKDESEYVCNQLQDHTWPATSPSQHTLLGKQNAEITSFGVPCKRRPLHAQRSIVRAKQQLLTQTKGVEKDPAFTSPCRLPLQNFKLEINADDDLENDQLVAKL